MRKEYNKLVRDRIPEIIRESGRECAVEVMSDSEYREALWQKLVEEAAEGRDASREIPEGIVTELADLYEVIDAIMVAHGIQQETVLEEQERKRLKRGGFEARLRLLWASDS